MPMRLFVLVFLFAVSWASDRPSGNARELLDKAVERHYAMRQYEVVVQTTTVSSDRLSPSLRERITVDEDMRAFHYQNLTDSKHQALSDGDMLWESRSRGVTEGLAEGPALRMWRQAIERSSARFALLGRSALDAEWVKWETVKRGRGRIECGVVRIRPQDPSSGNWTEMLWISPETGLIWRSVFVERSSPPSMSMGVPAGPVSRNPPMSLDVVRTREYDWVHTEGDLPSDRFARPPWAAKAKPR